MKNTRKSAFFIGILVVSTLILLNSCGKKGSENTQDDEKIKLKTEAQQFVDRLSSTLDLKGPQKKSLEKKLVEVYPPELNVKRWLTKFQSLQANLKVTGGDKHLSEANEGIKSVISGARDADLVEAAEVLDILINLLKNAKERAKLEAENKK